MIDRPSQQLPTAFAALPANLALEQTEQNFTMIRIFRFSFSILLAALLFACASQPIGSADVARMAERYPPGSIQTWSLSNAAQTDVVTAREEVEERFKATQSQCFEKFFAARCMDAAKERRRVDLSVLRKIEVEANAFERKAKAADRDISLSERERQADRRVGNIIPRTGEQRVVRPTAGGANKPED